MSKNTSFTLTEHFVTFIEAKVSEGRYGSASDVVRAGLRLLEEEEAQLERLQTALRQGEESGESVPVTKELMNDILQKAIARAKSGETIDYDPDVIGPGDEEPWGGPL